MEAHARLLERAVYQSALASAEYIPTLVLQPIYINMYNHTLVPIMEAVVTILLIVVVVLLLFGGGGYYGYRRW
jgi:hypothetical protein